MKCFAVKGTASRCEELIAVLRQNLPGRSIGLLRRGEDTALSLVTTGPESLCEFISSPSPDMILLDIPCDLAVPEVHCREGAEASWEPLELARFHHDEEGLPLVTVRGEDTPATVEERCGILYERVNHFLPQFESVECGRCGADCRGFTEALVRGQREPLECFFYPSGQMSVTVDGEPMKMGRFPSEMVEGTLRGLLSTLAGYREEADVMVRMGKR